MKPVILDVLWLGAGGAVAASTPELLSEHLMADMMIAMLGAFFAGAPGSQWTVKLWQIVLGFFAGTAAALILPSFDLAEGPVLAGIFFAAALSSKASGWISDTARFASDMKHIADGIASLKRALSKPRS